MNSRILAAACLLLCLGLSSRAFAQSTIGTLTGTVSDNSKAALPSVTVKILNEDTGLSQSMPTNDSGVYIFLLAPGNNYTLTAELPGFKKVTINKIAVRIGDTSTVNASLEVGDVVTTVVVDATRVDPLLKDPTIGITLGEQELMNLPLVGNDPLALITTLPGYRASPLGHEYDTVGGLPMSMINTVRDGLSVTDGFSPGGVGSTTILNPDMISEIRLILSPVDAEAGRGNGQVQITTRSGTNKFQWNINYNLRQNAFNSLGSSTTRIKQPFTAVFQYIVSVGGPVIKNRTFYFVNWDQQISYRRPFSQGGTCASFTTCASAGFTVVPALTETARNGVFRFFDGWNPTSAGMAINTGAVNTYPGVDTDGNAIAPPIWGGDGAPYDGKMHCFSVFGNQKFDGSPFTSQDCGTYYPRAADGSIDYNNPQQGIAIFPNQVDPFTGQASWDGHGRVPDRTGYISRLLAYMPRANYYETTSATGSSVISYGAEGLNRAGASFKQDVEGLNNRNTFRGGTFGTGLSLDQSQTAHRVLNIKIDHNINSAHRISMSTSFQRDRNSRTAASGTWPDGVPALAERVPHVLTLNGLSTISPVMVNEARFGISFNRSAQLAPWDNPDQETTEFARSFLPEGWPSYVNATCTSLNTGQCAQDGDPTKVYYIPAPGVSQGQNTFSGGGGLNGTRAFDFTSNVLPGTTQNSLSSFSGLPGFQTFTYQSNASTGFGGCLNATGLSIANCEIGSQLFNFADTFSWTTGGHTIRSGVEFRLTRAKEILSSVIPSATAGANSALAPVTGGGVCATNAGTACTLPRLADPTVYPAELPIYNETKPTRLTGLLNTSRGNARDLLYLLSGSVDTVNQQFWVNSVDNYRFGRWDSWDGNYCPVEGDLDRFCASDKGQQIRNTVQNEYAFFVKDDWRLTKNLTLNLGVRYENYGNLFIRGFSTGVLDAGYGLFGTSRYWVGNNGVEYVPYFFNYDPFERWMIAPNVAAGEGLYVTGYGPTPPAINVTGWTLPNGEPAYVPGFANSRTLPVQTAASGTYNVVDACVWGVQQSPLLPVSNCQPNMLTTRIFVGPDSRPKADPNAPDYTRFPSTYRDRNNIGPAIGFSYRLAAGSRTVLIRGGFQFTYGSAGRDRSFGTGTAGSLSNRNAGGGNNQVDQTTSTTPGTFCNGNSTCSGLAAGQAFTLADLPNIVPLKPTTVPSLGTPNGGGIVTGGSSNILEVQQFNNAVFNMTGYSPNYQDPRTENYTLSVSTNLTRTSTISLSYVGTLGRNRPTSVDLNTPNLYGRNPDGSFTQAELLQALIDTRAGKNSPYFDQMLAGFNLTGLGSSSGYGVIGQCVAVPVALQPGVNNGGPDNNYCGPGFIYQSGSAHLRQAAATRTNLANGNFNAVVTSLVANASAASVANGTALSAGAGSVTSYNTTWQGFVGGTLVRNGCDRLAFGGARAAINGGVTTGNTNGAIGGNPNSVVCYPEDYIRMNNSMDQAAYNDNWGFTNYHQVQMQYTLRTSNGMSIQATYLTSKTLALPRDFYRTSTFGYNATGGGFFGDTASRPPITGFSDPQSEESRRLDYGLSSDSLKHSVRVNAVMQLPFGPGQPLFSKASGILARIVGGWNLSVIYNAQSGAPFSIYAGDMLYGDQSGTATGGCNAYSGTSFASFFGSGANCQSGLSFPDVVSPLWSNPRGKLEINGPDGSTTFFGNPAPFALIPDPQCTNGASVGRNPISDIGGVYNTGTSACSLQALVMKVPEGTPGAFVSTSVDNGGTPLLIMLQNPLPGNRGSLGAQTMRQPSRFYLDASLSKNIMFTERRGIQLRLDATNVLNHPQPVDVYMSIGPGGQIVDRSDANSRALANGCFNQYQSNSTFNNTANSSLVNGLANCGRQVQVSFRMINN